MKVSNSPGAVFRRPDLFDVLCLIGPISKLFEEHGNAGELHKTEVVGGLILPTNEPPPLPLQPGKGVFDEPAPFAPW